MGFGPAGRPPADASMLWREGSRGPGWGSPPPRSASKLGFSPQQCQESSPDRVTLYSLMMKPIQRFPQFILLLQVRTCAFPSVCLQAASVLLLLSPTSSLLLPRAVTGGQSRGAGGLEHEHGPGPSPARSGMSGGGRMHVPRGQKGIRPLLPLSGSGSRVRRKNDLPSGQRVQLGSGARVTIQTDRACREHGPQMVWGPEMPWRRGLALDPTWLKTEYSNGCMCCFRQTWF